MSDRTVLVVCTANQCRSPAAQALLTRALADRAPVRVASAGLLPGGAPAAPGMVAAAAAAGIDLTAHTSVQVDEAMVAGADLVVGMARSHVRETVLMAPDSWPRSFTLRELVRRAAAAGPRGPQPWEEWLARVHHGRRHADLLGSSPEDDVADPMGGPPEGYRRTWEELARLTGRLADLAWPA